MRVLGKVDVGIKVRLIALLLCALFLSCGGDDSQGLSADITLGVRKVRSVEVWLRLVVALQGGPAAIRVERGDGKNVARWNLRGSSVDTILADETVRPDREYSYVAYVELPNGAQIDSSNRLSVQTRDTTRSTFRFAQYSIGSLGSYLVGASIVNDTCIWVCGNIYAESTSDSNLSELFGSARWDGTTWHLIPVKYRGVAGSTQYNGPLNAVAAVAPDNVFGVTDVSLLHWDGVSWTERAFFPTSASFSNRIRTLVVASDHLIFCGASNGVIYQVEDSVWSVLSNASNLDCVDMYSRLDPSSGNTQILGIRGQPLVDYSKEVITLSKGHLETLADSGIVYPPTSVWFDPGEAYYVVGWYIYNKESVVGVEPWVSDMHFFLPWAGPLAIRGNAWNDFVIGCANGEVYHYNGAVTTTYPDAYARGGLYRRVAMQGSLVVAVGELSGKALATMGWR
jgi:hypothetical protein